MMLVKKLAGWLERRLGLVTMSATKDKHMRALQVASVQSVSGPIALGNLILGAIVFVYATNHDISALLWFAVLLTSAGGLLYKWSRVRRSSESHVRRELKEGIYARLPVSALAQGILWSCVPLLFAPGATTSQQLVAFLATGGAVATASVSLSVLPVAAFAFALPVVAGAMASAFLLTGNPVAVPMSITFGAFLFILPAICRHNARTLQSIVESQSEARAQSETAHALLTHYQGEHARWTWATDARQVLAPLDAGFSAYCGRTGAYEDGMSICDLFSRLGMADETIAGIEASFAAGTPFTELNCTMGSAKAPQNWVIQGEPLLGSKGQVIGYEGTIDRSIPTVKEEESAANFAHLDELTGLLNRRSFNAAISEAVAELERTGTGFTLLCLDLDRFKLINDTFGHPTGDAILQEVSRRIRGCVRKTDGVARLGGDEFAILLTDECDPGYAARLSARLLQEVGAHCEVDGQEHQIGVSIGIAMAPLNGTQADQLLRNADLALYRSKEDGRGAFRFFEFQMDRERRERRMLEQELEIALERGQFRLLYQPIVDTMSCRTVAMETLIRWDHPIRGRISPVEFIPVAEQSSAIDRIGAFTLREACCEAASWDGDAKVTVNISTRHFQSPDLIGHVNQALEESGLDPTRLEIEITETVLANETELALRTLTQLRDRGISISLDDFGTGYSSLSYMMKFPFDKLKIDRAFVMHSLDDPVARAILKMITDLGRTLKMTITAEGVETAEQYGYLRTLGCDQIQGFYFSRPLERDVASQLLSKENAEPEVVVEDEQRRLAAG